MADTMQFDLVSPERRLVSVPVREVRLPGTDGDLTAMPGHAATIVTLRPGIVTVGIFARHRASLCLLGTSQGVRTIRF